MLESVHRGIPRLLESPCTNMVKIVLAMSLLYSSPISMELMSPKFTNPVVEVFNCTFV